MSSRLPGGLRGPQGASGVLRGPQGASVVQDAQVTRHDLVLQHGARRDVDAVAVVGDDDDRSLGNGGRTDRDLLWKRVGASGRGRWP